MGPRSKDAVVAALGHIIDELLQQRHTLARIEGKVSSKAEQEDLEQANTRMRDLERAHVRLRNRVDGLPPTPAE